MEFKTPLTNEKVRKKFKSQFDLVNYAIKLAENMIRTGRDCRVRLDSQNRAFQVLSEIVQDKDQFDEIPVMDMVSAEEVQRFDRQDKGERLGRGERSEEGRRSGASSADRKKARKMLAE